MSAAYQPPALQPLVYNTLVALLADLSPPDGTPAIVIGDSTPSNNTRYLKSGRSGLGNWTLDTDLAFLMISKALGNVGGYITTTALGAVAAGATLRSISDKLSDVISVKDFGARGNGTTDDTLAVQAAQAYVDLIGYGSLYFPAGNYLINGTVSTAGDQVSWYGAGMGISNIISGSGTNNTDFVVKFTNSAWTSNAVGRRQYIFLSDMTFNGAHGVRPGVFLGGVGFEMVWRNVEMHAHGLSAIYGQDVWDCHFDNLKVTSCGTAHVHGSDIYTHAVMLMTKFDNTNALRFNDPHFEYNVYGDVWIDGTSNNISFHGMPKFEGSNSKGLYPTLDFSNALQESIRIVNAFVSRDATCLNYFLYSRARDTQLLGGSYISPSDTTAATVAPLWFWIDQTGSTTVVPAALIDINVIHINGTTPATGYPIYVQGRSKIRIHSVRLLNPNCFMRIESDTKVVIDELTTLGATSSPLPLFSIKDGAIADILVDAMPGTVTGVLWAASDTATNATTRLRSQVKISQVGTSTSVQAITDGFDPLGYWLDEVLFTTAGATADVATIQRLKLGSIITVRCTGGFGLVTGGNLFMKTAAFRYGTISLQSVNISFRQGWQEVARTSELNFTKAWTPGSLGSQISISTTVAVSGARMGDPVLASFNIDMQGCTISAYVSASNVVTVVITNNTAAAVTIAAGTVAVSVNG